MAEITAGRATRLARPSWLDARLLLGILLVLVAVVAGARVFASADRFDRLYVAAHPLVPGEHLAAADLTTGQVRLDGQGAADYLAAGAAPPVGYVVQRYVGAGELLPLKAIAPASTAGPDRLVTLPVQPGHLPPDVGPGTLVDLYLTPKTASGDTTAAPRLVARDLPVQGRQGGASALAGTTVLSLVVAVPTAQVAPVVRAVESGALDVVMVPAAQAAAATPAAGPAGPSATARP
jgi:hypothetical protein